VPNIMPFRGTRFNATKAPCGDVICPPARMINPESQQKLYSQHTHNMVRMISPYQYEYQQSLLSSWQRATSHLNTWREEGTFIQDDESLYMIEQQYVNLGYTHIRRGIIARVLLGEWGRHGIYPHRRAKPEATQKHLSHLRALRGNTEPIIALIADEYEKAFNLLHGIAGYKPAEIVIDPTDTTTRIWVMNNSARVKRLADALGDFNLVVAEGHSKYDAALQYRNEVRDQIKKAGMQPPALGELPCDYAMMMLVPDCDRGLSTRPMHRLLSGFPFDLYPLIGRLSAPYFRMEPVDSIDELQLAIDNTEAPTIGFAYGDNLWKMSLTENTAIKAVCPAALETGIAIERAALDMVLVPNLLNSIKPDQTTPLISSNFHRDEVLAAVKNGSAQAAFFLRALRQDEIVKTALHGQILPESSTCFLPDLWPGFVLNLHW